jgi:hypothetical protein
MRSCRLFLKALGVFALGVFLSCASNSADDLYPQNRVVRVLGFDDLTPSAEDSMLRGIYPDSLSGWILHWELPLETAELNGIYVFGDTIAEDVAKTRLVSGTGDMDLQGLPFLAQLPPTDTTWEIRKFFKDAAGKWLQGRHVRSDTAYYFSVWLRYNKDVTGKPVYMRMFLGDEMAPVLPILSDSVGQTNYVVRLPRPSDQTSKFDTTLEGPLSSIEIRYWPGSSATDSADTATNVNRVQSVVVPKAKLQDPAVDTFRLELSGLRYYTAYCYTLTVTDSVGLSSTSPVQSFTTHDSLPPAPPASLASTIAGFDTLHLSWEAATDSFGGGGSALRAHPNHHIALYKVVLNGVAVDSLDLTSDTAGAFGAGGEWSSSTSSTPTRFAWNGSVWTWTWPNLQPGRPFAVSVSARDFSGNDTRSPPSLTDTASSPAGFSCPAGYMAITGSGNIKDYCIEEREHRSNGVAQHAVTWKQALDICSTGGGFLCSDSQWVRACETNPSGTLAPYGSVETGFFNGTLDYKDSTIWLNKVCQLGTGDSTNLYELSSDPRCVSGWGVFDMPGGLAEWTRDVYHTSPGSTGKRDSNLAWIDTSDLTGKTDVGTIHGGSWLVLDQTDLTLPSATCRERNYPAFANLYDSLTSGTRRRANPNGFSIGVGFRCCRPPSP